ncbi:MULTISPECIES: hypothetical protein [unclassified Streptomyces]|uniref:hypothetical protein n=1 Tax=unclassified Streptomyces TaxID=2593676 RepID=UPI001F40E8DB|nr:MULTISPECIES: hypothetical protein [unclassified Streptomyces]
MAKTSSMLRAFAYTADNDGPAHTFPRPDQVTQGVSEASLVTVLLAVLRPAADGRWQGGGRPPADPADARRSRSRHLNEPAAHPCA